MGFCRSLGASLTAVLSWRHVRVVDLRTQAVANPITDGRLVQVGWLHRPDKLHANCRTILNSPENRFGGCEDSVASLVRELLLDHATGQLLSRPIAEYSNLHTKAFVEKVSVTAI